MRSIVPSCPAPNCTRVHDHNRFRELCPRALDRKQTRDRRYSAQWREAHLDLKLRQNQASAARLHARTLADLGITVSGDVIVRAHLA